MCTGMYMYRVTVIHLIRATAGQAKTAKRVQCTKLKDLSVHLLSALRTCVRLQSLTRIVQLNTCHTALHNVELVV